MYSKLVQRSIPPLSETRRTVWRLVYLKHDLTLVPITDVSMIVSATSPRRPFPLKKRLASVDVLTSSSRPAREQDSALPSTTKQWPKAVALVLVGGRWEEYSGGVGGEKAHSTLYRHFQANLSTGDIFFHWKYRGFLSTSKE